MDFKDIQERVGLIYASIDETVSTDIDEIEVRDVTLEGVQGIVFNFGSSTLHQLQGKVMAVLNNIASLKDLLKMHCNAKGLDPKIVEDQINSSKELSVLTDVVNAYKHGGYPLNTPRSGLDPEIKNIMQAMAPNPDYSGNDYGYTNNPNTGEQRLGDGSRIVIDAEIYDKNGNLLFDLDHLVQVCLERYEHLISENNLK